MNLDWASAGESLSQFGGEPVHLEIPKTGMPFFDAMQLYGTVDLYIGMREDVCIHDAGNAWQVKGHSRTARLKSRGERAVNRVWNGSLKPKFRAKLTAGTYYEMLRTALVCGWPKANLPDSLHQANGPFSGLDSAIQSGIRGIAAASYHTMQSGQSSDKVCIAHVPFSQGFLAVCGQKRTQTIGDIVFLPIFEGPIDLAKVVSPISAWVASPNPLCAQALMLLALKVSLFTEGFQDRLTAVVYNKRVKQGDFAYSGLIGIASTAVASDKMKSATLASDCYQSLRQLVRDGWENGRATAMAIHAFAMAAWVMHPIPQNLGSMIASQERLHRDRKSHVFASPESVKEIFNMSYEWKDEDYETVRRFARAVASGIFYARMKEEEDRKKRGKVWFDEVTLLRSAPSARAFVRRAMYLIEKGHAQHSGVGTEDWNQSFEPKLLRLIGEKRKDFDAFRELFRMYLVQESRPVEKDQTESPDGDGGQGSTPSQSNNEEEA